MENKRSGIIPAMRVNRKRTVLKKISKSDDSYVNASPQERISFMWELTAELWSLKGPEYVKRRLQRNITKLIKRKPNRKVARRVKDKLDVKYLLEN